MDRIYAIGGFDSQKFLSSIERYDQISNKWTEVNLYVFVNFKQNEIILFALEHGAVHSTNVINVSLLSTNSFVKNFVILMTA